MCQLSDTFGKWELLGKVLVVHCGRGCVVSVEKQVGNVAAMREALVAVKKGIDGMGISSLDCDPMILMSALTQICARLSARIDAALALPLRNCDVGTVEEQKNRFDHWCFHYHTGRCSRNCSALPAKTFKECTLRWAQMPYTEEGGAS